MDNYSLSDIAAVTGDGMGGGNNWFAWILLFALFGGGFGNRANCGGGCASTEDLASGFNFSGLQNKTNEILAAVNSEGRTTDNAVCQLGYQTQQGINELARQIAECCCQTQLGTQQVKFDMANYSAATNQTVVEQTQKVLDKLCGMEMAQKDATIYQQGQRIAALEADARMCGVPRVNPYGYGIYAYPACNPCGPCNGQVTMG